MQEMIFPQTEDFGLAVSLAYGSAPSCIGWMPGGWIVYDPTQTAPKGITPEFLVFKQGNMPLPLNESAIDVWCSFVSAMQTKLQRETAG